jgi:hypothetical protein
MGTENILKLTTGNVSLHQDSNDNCVRIINFAKSKNLVVKSLMFLHRNIHQYTWTSADGKTHNQIDHILIDRRWHLSILDIRSFRAADCDTDQYLVVAKVRERLDAALENLSVSKDINRGWKNMKGNIKISAKEILGLYKLKQYNPWFDDKCLHILDQRKHAKMH